MREVTATGKTIAEAIDQALAQLNVTEDQIKVTVIDDAKKGFLGIGSKKAVIKATVLTDFVEETKEFLQTVIEKMGISVSIEKKVEEDGVLFELSSDKAAVLIGKRGQTLNSLEYLAGLVANRYTDEYIRIHLDIEDYRSRRKATLIQLAERQAEKVLKLNRMVALEPMPAKERKIIHLTLKNKPGVSTESKGEGMNRHVIIIPK